MAGADPGGHVFLLNLVEFWRLDPWRSALICIKHWSNVSCLVSHRSCLTLQSRKLLLYGRGYRLRWPCEPFGFGWILEVWSTSSINLKCPGIHLLGSIWPCNKRNSHGRGWLGWPGESYGWILEVWSLEISIDSHQALIKCVLTCTTQVLFDPPPNETHMAGADSCGKTHIAGYPWAFLVILELILKDQHWSALSIDPKCPVVYVQLSNTWNPHTKADSLSLPGHFRPI